MRSILFAPILAVIGHAMLLVPSACAGTICGTVRDGATSLPVERAGVFVRLPAGAYTGHHGATDGTGSFCIGGIPAGTYDLEVRVDDYVAAFRRNVVVSEGPASVNLEVPSRDVALFLPSPNPARTRVLFRIDLRRPTPVRVEVLDAQGRRLRGWSAPSAQGVRTIDWDFKTGGREVGAGRYFVRLVTPGYTVTRAFSRVP